MWHEARRQEKKIRGLMVDYKRRAERRREFYEKIKADPAVYVRVFGQHAKINLDPAIALAAESPQSMMPWQGDTSNMIDRFDVRAHLDIMPPEKSYTVELSKEEQSEERKANYERYRILVENECAGLTEEQALHQLYIDEQFGAINKDQDEEKNKRKDKKAAIGYTYEDSTDKGAGKDDSDDDDEESEEDDIETFDLDIVLDVDTLTEEQKDQLNVCGIQFGMGKKDYIKYLHRDKDEQEAVRQAKILEEEKAQFAGRKSRIERRKFNEKRLAGRALSPPSYAARESPKYEPYRRSSSRSRSRSKSPPRRRKKMYITSFGGGDESDEGAGVVQGPALPPGFQAASGGAASGASDGATESTNAKTATALCDGKGNKKESLRQRLGRSLSPDGDLSPRSKDREYNEKISKSRDRHSGRSRSPGYRSRSRGYRSRSRGRRSRSRGRRSRSRGRRSRSRGYHPRDRRSRDRAFRSRSRDRRSYNRSERSHYQRSRERSRDRSRGGRSRSPRYSRSDRSRSRKSRSRSRSRSRSSSRSSSRSKKSRSKSKSRSPVKPIIKRYRRESLSPKGSSDSDDNSTSNASKQKSSNSPSVGHTSSVKLPGFGKSGGLSQAKLTPQERLKKRMQIALSKQYKADKKAEVERHEKITQEKLDREEELRQRALEMRRREREKRHREMEGAYSSDDDNISHGSSPRRRPERSPRQHEESPRRREESPRRLKEEEMAPRRGNDSPRKKYRRRSQSRSSSASPPSKKIVDY